MTALLAHQGLRPTISLIRAALDRPKTFTGWTLREATNLSTFSFAKEAMFKDLTDNEAQILEERRLRAAIQEAIDAPLEGRTKKVPSIERHVVETEEADWDSGPGR